jgi:hypothetical protein
MGEQRHDGRAHDQPATSHDRGGGDLQDVDAGDVGAGRAQDFQVAMA